MQITPKLLTLVKIFDSLNHSFNFYWQNNEEEEEEKLSQIMSQYPHVWVYPLIPPLNNNNQYPPNIGSQKRLSSWNI